MNKTLVLILCKELSDNVHNLEHSLDLKKIKHQTICDLCTINDDSFLKENGYYNCTRSPYIKKPSSWDKAFYIIDNKGLLDVYDYFFFIEDDVYSKNYDSLTNFILEATQIFTVDFITKQIRPQSHHPKWKHWQEQYISELKNPSQSFNPLCRLSKKLVQKILDYRKSHSKFEFHEILIPSLCIENNLSYINYVESSILNKYIGRFRYNPILTVADIVDNLIYHPVKYSKDAREKGIVSS